MNKNAIRARIDLIKSLLRCADTIMDELNTGIEKSDDAMYDITCYTNLIAKESTEEILDELIAAGYIDANEDDGEKLYPPSIETNNLWITVTQTVPGGQLCVGTCTSDYNTPQAYIDYIASDSKSDVLSEINLALAEIKRGELAEKSDNQDINLYVWSDPYQEDMTHNWIIKKSDIDTALNEGSV